jgi:hypothetical protein
MACATTLQRNTLMRATGNVLLGTLNHAIMISHSKCATQIRIVATRSRCQQIDEIYMGTYILGIVLFTTLQNDYLSICITHVFRNKHVCVQLSKLKYRSLSHVELQYFFVRITWKQICRQAIQPWKINNIQDEERNCMTQS